MTQWEKNFGRIMSKPEPESMKKMMNRFDYKKLLKP
jgi:hypothetical protein